MVDTYESDELADDRDEPVTIERRCSRLSGCNNEIAITVYPDGSYDGGMYFGTVTQKTDESELVTERLIEDEWMGSLPRVEWSDTIEREFWLHTSCAEPDDVDPEEVDKSVA